MSDWDDKNNDSSASCNIISNTLCPQRLLNETHFSDSKKRVENKAAERSRLYRVRHREEINQRRRQQRQKKSHQIHSASNVQNIHEIEDTQATSNNQTNSRTQRQQRYYERHKEEINKRKRESRRKQNILQAIPVTAAERNRNYRERHKKAINKRRRDSRLRQQNTDNEIGEAEETVASNIPVQDTTAENKASIVNDWTIKEENSSKITSKDPAKCICGSVLDTMIKDKWQKDEGSYKARIVIKNRKINNLQKINARLHKRNSILKNTLNLIKRNKYVEPSVLQELSRHDTEEPNALIDLLEIKEEKIQYNEHSHPREADKDPVQVYGHNFIDDPIPIKLEVIDDTENYPEDGSSFSAENLAGNEQENLFSPQTMITVDVPPIDSAMDIDNETNLLNKLTNVLDEFDKWALKIAKQIKSMTNIEEKVNVMNATQSLVDAYLAKDANTSLNTVTSKSDEPVARTLLKSNKTIFVPSMLPVMGGILIPQQETSHETMTPQAVQIQPIILPNLIQMQKETKK